MLIWGLGGGAPVASFHGPDSPTSSDMTTRAPLPARLGLSTTMFTRPPSMFPPRSCDMTRYLFKAVPREGD